MRCVLVLAFVFALLHAGRAGAATLALAPPVMLGDYSALIDVSGTHEPTDHLYVHASRNAACAATAGADTGDDLTPGGWMLVSPFTLSVPFLFFSGGSWLVCAYLAESPTATPDAVASATVVSSLPVTDPVATPAAPDPDAGSQEIPTPVPALLGPFDGAAQESFNPVFRWTRWADADESDTLVLARRYPDGTTATLLTLDDEQSDTYHDDAGEPADILGDTKALAAFTSDATTVSVQLERPLPPATYVWSVEREDVTSPSRAFTVLGPRVTRLRASVRSTRGRTPRHPGSSTLHVTTSAAAKVRVALHRRGHLSTLAFTADDDGHVDVAVPWSCSHAGGTYEYVVEASDQYGAQLKRSGRFTPVTPTRCRSLERHATRAADRRAAAEHAAWVGRFEARCAALGGKPVSASGGPEIVCRSPLGGLLNVPM
jgi:hypothetical protein